MRPSAPGAPEECSTEAFVRCAVDPHREPAAVDSAGMTRDTTALFNDALRLPERERIELEAVQTCTRAKASVALFRRQFVQDLLEVLGHRNRDKPRSGIKVVVARLVDHTNEAPRCGRRVFEKLIDLAKLQRASVFAVMDTDREVRGAAHGSSRKRLIFTHRCPMPSASYQ
jgi:hypothetical protein